MCFQTLGKLQELFTLKLKSRSVIDCRSKVQTIESDFSWHMESTTEEHTIESKYLPILNYNRMFEELELYKNEKLYYNISIVKENLKKILEVEGWYALIIPKMHLRIDSMIKLETITDFCIMVMKSYMDKFYKYEKERWEAPLLEYQELTASDSNFVDEYRITYTQEYDADTIPDTIDQFVKDVSTLLSNDQGIIEYEKGILHGSLVAFDFRNHLYAPLICLKANGLKLQISPVSLNTDEKLFVDRLKTYVDSHSSDLEGKSLFLIRNKSKVGMGFFEAGNFYPDYVLWIDTPETQYITFIDPKGLLRLQPYDPKVMFFSKIKELEERLQPTATDKQIVLNSFIMSGTRSADLRQWWNMTKLEREEKHVMCLDNDDCVDVMMQKIMEE